MCPRSRAGEATAGTYSATGSTSGFWNKHVGSFIVPNFLKLTCWFVRNFKNCSNFFEKCSEKYLKKMFEKFSKNFQQNFWKIFKIFFEKKNLKNFEKNSEIFFSESMQNHFLTIHFFCLKSRFSRQKFFDYRIFFGILGFRADFFWGKYWFQIFGPTGFVCSSGVLNQFRSRKTPGIAHKAA